MELKTKRLLLRTVGLADAETIYAYRSSPEVSRYQGRLKSLAEAKRRVAIVAALKPDTPRTWYQLAVIEKAGGALIGDIAIHFTDKKQAELGYTLAPEFQGRGFATEAVIAVAGWLFKKLKKHRITASVDPRNTSSIRLLERIGMRKEGYFKKSFWTGKTWADDAFYAILREEWGK